MNKKIKYEVGDSVYLRSFGVGADIKQKYLIIRKVANRLDCINEVGSSKSFIMGDTDKQINNLCKKSDFVMALSLFYGRIIGFEFNRTDKSLMKSVYLILVNDRNNLNDSEKRNLNMIDEDSYVTQRLLYYHESSMGRVVRIHNITLNMPKLLVNKRLFNSWFVVKDFL